MHPVDDALTGLRSRRAFLPLLRRQALLANERRASLALVVVDIDGFSRINGTHGYDTGDEVLAHVARQIAAVTRAHDHAARIGDNRFALLLVNVMNAGHVELAVHKLQRLLDVPLQTADARLKVEVTAGAALCPLHASHPDRLLRRAEAALVRARREGARLAFASDALADHDVGELWDLEFQLAGAIERGELQMHFQPQVRAADLGFTGAEALMRWTSPTRGDVPPDVFIPIAERTGLIKKLTVWALNSALRQAAHWPVEGRRVTVAVNLPGMLATQEDLPDLVSDALRLWAAPHVRLVLEITEGSLMDAGHAFDILERIRALGVGISIDDFGTGYSCLAYFKSIPADEVKVDRTFVQSLASDEDTAALVRLIVELAHRFGLGVAAEGLEDAATLAALRALGCDTVQGFLVGRPMPQDVFLDWLPAHRQAAVAP